MQISLTVPPGRPSPDRIKQPVKFIAHSFQAANIAMSHGWLPGARYSNLRDVRKFDRLGFLDIDWKNYSFRQHLAAAKMTRPTLTVACDIIDMRQLDQTLDQAHELARFCERVVIVPKAIELADYMDEVIPPCFTLGFSVPTRYGGTTLPYRAFSRPVHLLGGRPDVQRSLAKHLTVESLDCNRFTLDARFGDYFDGSSFRPHPIGGYERCISDSIVNINTLWHRVCPGTL